MEPNELCFTALGPSGSGKTTILASMYNELERVKSGVFYPAADDPIAFDRLDKAYEDLMAMANSSDDDFTVRIQPTQNMREYTFTLFGAKDRPVKFFDYPGGWLNPNHQNHNQVTDMMKQSSVIFVTINTPFIMEEDGKYEQRAGVKDIQACLQECFIDNENNRDKLVLFIPIKCERYTQPSGDVKVLREKLKEDFRDLLRDGSGPAFCKGHLAIALLPVQTVGNRKFKKFIVENSILKAEAYGKIGDKFSPRNADQPMRFALSFLLKQFEKGDGFFRRIWRDLFGDNSQLKKDMDNFIRKGIRLNDPEFEIFCGSELIV